MTQPDRSDELLLNLKRIIRAVDIHSRVLRKRYGLTGPQLLVLRTLKNGHEIGVSEMARTVSLSAPTVTSILDRLEARGMVTRRRAEEDKRKVLVAASDKAAGILATNPSLLQVEFVDRFNKLQEWEQTLILSSVQRVASMMDAERIEAEPLLSPEQHADSETG